MSITYAAASISPPRPSSSDVAPTPRPFTHSEVLSVSPAVTCAHTKRACVTRHQVREECELVRLPCEVLELVLLHVAHPFEFYGVRGLTMAVRDVVAASSTCVAMWHARTPALASLARALVPTEVFGNMNYDWNRLIRLPMTFTALQLREVACAFNLPKSGTKRVVAERIRVDAFGLKTPFPSQIDVLVARALFREKREGASRVRHAFYSVCDLFHRYHPTIRETSFEVRYPLDATELREQVAAHFPTLQLLENELARLVSVETSYRAMHPPPPQLYCACGRKAALACKQKRCYYCCRRYSSLCYRHGVPVDSDESDFD